MAFQFLEFEKPIAELEARIDELRQTAGGGTVSLEDEVTRLQRKADSLTDGIFAKLTPVQIAQLARHPERPYTLDYIRRMFTDFEELHGDRMFGDDAAIVGGLARLGERPVLVIGHQKGRDVQEKVRRNFGMPKPEGYRKAQRLMKLADRLGIPVVSLVDTPGAYPGIDAEERGQAEAIATCLEVQLSLKVPFVSVITGEGGSGGALAMAVADRVLMLENSVYSVISPEGCAAILWKEATKDTIPLAAEALKMTAPDLLELKIIDEVIKEPVGGAHASPELAMRRVGAAILGHLGTLKGKDCRAARRERFLKMT